MTTACPLTDYDVLVVGGGPAGAAAAITAAQGGLSVVLIEREATPSAKPGEALHPGIAPLLEPLGVSSAALESVTGVRFPGIWTAWRGPPVFEPFGEDAAGPWLGFQVRRQAFESLLLNRASAVGVDVRFASSARDPLVMDGRVMGAGDIRAKVTIDATGPARWLSRKLDLDAVQRSPRLIARYGYVRGGAPDYRAAPRLEGDDEGWTWIARVDTRLYQWVRLDFDGRLRPRTWKPPQLERLVEARPTQGADVVWRRASQVAGPGWLLIGDAAAQLDPASSHGVLKALMSGVMAAQVAVAVRKRSAPEIEAARAYQTWLSGWFDTDVRRLAAAYRALGAVGFG